MWYHSAAGGGKTEKEEEEKGGRGGQDGQEPKVKWMTGQFGNGDLWRRSCERPKSALGPLKERTNMAT